MTAERNWKRASLVVAVLAAFTACSTPSQQSTPSPPPAKAPGSGDSNDSPILVADGSIRMKTKIGYQGLSTNKHDATFQRMGYMAQSLDVFDDSGFWVANLPVWNMPWEIDNTINKAVISEAMGALDVHGKLGDANWTEIVNSQNQKIGVKHGSKHLLPATIMINGMDATPKDPQGNAVKIGAVCIHYCTDSTCGAGGNNTPLLGVCPSYGNQ